MSTKTNLDEDLFDAYAWVAAAGEIKTFTAMTEAEADVYATEAAANAIEHDEENVTESTLVSLWTWLQSRR